jgi:caa(3)-type oxidase subunit IV
MSDPTHDHHGQHAPHGDSFYVKIYFALMVLFAISVLGPTLEIAAVTLVTAFGVAIVKAGLVAANFMHLNTERRYIWYMLLAMLAFVLVFFAGVAPDVMQHSGTNWEKVAEVEVPPQPALH